MAGEEKEGLSQRMCIKDSWAKTMVRGVGGGLNVGGGGWED